MEDLDVKLRDELDLMFREARAKMEQGAKEEAVRLAEAAWQRFPPPKFGWDVSKSYTHALTQIYRDAGRYNDALELMRELFASGTVKPHQDGPHFFIGTVYFEMGDIENARKSFKEANRISKGRCFQGQPEKYKQVLSK